MKERLIGFIKTYILFVSIFILQKPLFMLCHYVRFAEFSWTDWLSVVWYGLPIDLSLAGWLSVLAGLFYIVSTWTVSETLRRVWMGYFFVVSVLIAAVFVVDAALYGLCSLRLDATQLLPLFHLLSGMDTGGLVITIVSLVVLTLLLYGLFHATLLSKSQFARMKLPYFRLNVSGWMLLFTGLLYLPIRGSFVRPAVCTDTASTSLSPHLNGVSVNPIFNLMESLLQQASRCRPDGDTPSEGTWMKVE